MTPHFFSFLNKTNKATVALTGIPRLGIQEILHVAHNRPGVILDLDNDSREAIEACYQCMIKQVKDGVPIYGTNSSFGEQASRLRINHEEKKRIKSAKEISESLLFTDVSVGPDLPDELVRAAMLIRANMLLQGVSAVKLQDIEVFITLLDKNITPVVGAYGSLGASGDLAQNCRILSAAMHKQHVKVKAPLQDDPEIKIRNARETLQDHNIKPLELDPKAGLGMVNGDNFSTAAAILLFKDVSEIMLLNILISALMVQVLRGTSRSFHPLLACVRRHPGQRMAADLFRDLLDGGELAYNKMNEQIANLDGMSESSSESDPDKLNLDVSIQDAYSLRCLSQFLAPDLEILGHIKETLEINANGVSDNPLWVKDLSHLVDQESTDSEIDHYNFDKKDLNTWVSGCNFLGMHMAESIDQMRKIITRLVKLNDRHLARLVNTNKNSGLPSNLSHWKGSVSGCTFKGLQIQMGMMEVYTAALATPITTTFGIHEENNQDVTAHGLTSWLLARENLCLARYAAATNLIAAVQAVDLRWTDKDSTFKSKTPRDLLSPGTRHCYDFVRDALEKEGIKVGSVEKDKLPLISEDQPMSHFLEAVYSRLCDNESMHALISPLLNKSG